MNQLIDRLATKFPRLRFAAGQQFSWSPESGEIIYKADAGGREAEWSLLHETGHALLGHKSYGADFELLRMEVDAWERAKILGRQLDITIDEDHVQDCLDTYRDWLCKRSICPSCGTKCLQQDDHRHYRCHNCHTVWQVSASRFGRAYRRRQNFTTREQVTTPG